jgi:hypothetical protein
MRTIIRAAGPTAELIAAIVSAECILSDPFSLREKVRMRGL